MPPVLSSSSPTPPLNKVLDVPGPLAFLAALIAEVEEVSAAFFAWTVCWFKKAELSGGLGGFGAIPADIAAVPIIDAPIINAVVVPIAIF